MNPEDFQEFFYVFFRFPLFVVIGTLVVSALVLALVELIGSVNQRKLPQ